MTTKELEIKSLNYRKKVLQYIKKANAGHTGGSLSCTDILNVLYNEVMNVSPENFSDPNRDRYIQSKGHSVEALFVVLADQGFYPESEIETLCQYRSHFIGHPTRKVPGVEQNTGALGHGLPISVGTALAGKMDGLDYRVFTMMGDGELLEGSNWEAAMAAAHYKLDNLVAILDYNKLQITGAVKDVCNSEPIDQKFEAFGWSVKHVDGNDVEALSQTLKSAPFEAGKPSFVIAHTIKGKGISFMENNIKWHHGVPSDEQYAAAQKELDGQLEELSKALTS
ncbi:transketolase [Echinicola vietnamensis]|uniref:Transketolase, beta subunit n=1 Tax=Echinicola vietnamensis (strain DSM 17526 / LMG 23754 / KMM 6221) TaxID=926556 RepID=L0FW90_ECHVK|nr:transketolase [Echinicola vietnamensis]AGA77557.1 transketolase, beta subunit [Echinicola vietnamensis DSM 17526]